MSCIEDIYREQDKNKQVHMLILDIIKAFDTVPHQRQLMKLKQHGIDSSLQRILDWRRLAHWRIAQRRIDHRQKAHHRQKDHHRQKAHRRRRFAHPLHSILDTASCTVASVGVIRYTIDENRIDECRLGECAY